MYSILLPVHSYLRYFVLALLIAVVIKSFLGWSRKQNFTRTDDKLSLWLLIATHLQLLAGLALYFASSFVQFGPETMKNGVLRYWTVEHATMMIVAIILITVARITHKKLASDGAKHKRLFLFNAFALAIAVLAILASGRAMIG